MVDKIPRENQDLCLSVLMDLSLAWWLTGGAETEGASAMPFFFKKHGNPTPTFDFYVAQLEFLQLTWFQPDSSKFASFHFPNSC
jgi:hypothetical protein